MISDLRYRLYKLLLWVVFYSIIATAITVGFIELGWLMLNAYDFESVYGSFTYRPVLTGFIFFIIFFNLNYRFLIESVYNILSPEELVGLVDEYKIRDDLFKYYINGGNKNKCVYDDSIFNSGKDFECIQRHIDGRYLKNVSPYRLDNAINLIKSSELIGKVGGSV